MKTKFLVGAGSVSILLTATVLGQSTFKLRNYEPIIGIDAPVTDTQGVRLAGVDYAAELWGGATSNSLSPTLDFTSRQRVIVPFLTGKGAGYFESAKSMTVWSVSGNPYAWVQVRAWDARIGPTYEEVSALGIGGFGESLLLYIQGGDPTSAPPDAPRPLFGLQSFSLRPVVPEPSTWALFALGGVAVVWAARCQRHRKK